MMINGRDMKYTNVQEKIFWRMIKKSSFGNLQLEEKSKKCTVSIPKIK